MVLQSWLSWLGQSLWQASQHRLSSSCTKRFISLPNSSCIVSAIILFRRSSAWWLVLSPRKFPFWCAMHIVSNFVFNFFNTNILLFVLNAANVFCFLYSRMSHDIVLQKYFYSIIEYTKFHRVQESPLTSIRRQCTIFKLLRPSLDQRTMVPFIELYPIYHLPAPILVPTVRISVPPKLDSYIKDRNSHTRGRGKLVPYPTSLFLLFVVSYMWYEIIIIINGYPRATLETLFGGRRLMLRLSCI